MSCSWAAFWGPEVASVGRPIVGRALIGVRPGASILMRACILDSTFGYLYLLFPMFWWVDVHL